MLLRLQRYNLNVHYKKGKEMFLVDTLSRAFIFTPEANVSAFVQELKRIDHNSALPFTETRWHQIKQASPDDPVFWEMRKVVGLRTEKPSLNAYILTSI